MSVSDAHIIQSPRFLSVSILSRQRHSTVTIFSSRIKAWTCLDGKLPVAVNRRSRISLTKLHNKPFKRITLLRCTRVSRVAVSIQSTHISHPDRAIVLTLAVSADLVLGPTGIHASVKPHKIVIAYASESLRTMPPVHLSHTDLPPRRRSSAMNNYLRYTTHPRDCFLPSHGHPRQLISTNPFFRLFHNFAL